MKPPIARVSIFFALCLSGLLQADTKLGVEPTSGIIVRGDQKVWFDVDSIRTETYQDGRLVQFDVTGGRGFWLAYPEIGRVLTTTVDRQHWRSYQEQARQFFSRTTNHFRLGEEEFLGLPCWRYEWVETNLPLHGVDGEFFTREVQYLFLANPTFPLVMRQGSGGSWNTNWDVREIKLDVPVSDALFELPKGLKTTKQFQVPRQPFELVLRQTRSSPKWGWSTLVTTSFSSDGEVIKAKRTNVRRDENGERITGPTETVRPFNEALLQFNYPMGVPMGRWMRKTGTDEIIGFQADVLKTDYADERFWVIDHPQFGAFSARRVIGGDTPETNEVVRIWVGD
jgi:hypothetical protein